ncbi:MAG: DUF4430 domain-containing protein [Candidatus Lokiarchaeota archaeon]|nr:DUF4430 domain-containing protein [Candidatus Lokiarchaeota archaeon]
MNAEKVIFICLTIAIGAAITPFVTMYTIYEVDRIYRLNNTPIASNITVTIDYGNGTIENHYDLAANTPLKALQLVAVVSIQSSIYGDYVDGINGHFGDTTHGWGYEVNNVSVMDAASDYILGNNDRVLWEYFLFEW